MAACSPKTVPSAGGPQPSPDQVKERPVLDTKPENLPAPAVTKETGKQSEHLISLLLPFELESIDYHTAELSEMAKAEIAIDFYQGFKMALDSVAHQSRTDFKLQIYDSKDDPSYMNMLAGRAGIKNSEVIVGPVFPNGIKAFTPYSIHLKKIMVSPLAAATPETFNNPYLITLNNSIEQHAAKAVDFAKSLKPKKIVLIRSGQSDEYKYAVPFKKEAVSVLKNIPLTEIGIKAVGYENVFKSLSPVGLNVVVLPSTDRNFLLSITNELQKLTSNFEIAVIGHPSWEKLEFLNGDKMEDIQAYITSSYQVDYQDSRVEQLVKNYRNQFNLEPGEYAFKGFDTGYFIGKLLSEEGKDFSEELTRRAFHGVHNDFKLERNDQTGYFNTHVMMLKYEDYKLKPVD